MIHGIFQKNKLEGGYFDPLISSGSDNIFKKQKRSKWPFLLVICLAVGIYFLSTHEVPTEEIIADNQQTAIQNLKVIEKALLYWKEQDYDANGEKDFPLDRLRRMVETKMVNNRSLNLLPANLAAADLREDKPVPHHGYYFTLIHRETKWPSQKITKDIVIYAKPAVRGKTGTCAFLVHVNGKAWYSNYNISSQKPQWPSKKEFKANIWHEFDLHQ